jgi:hypothetical protein
MPNFMGLYWSQAQKKDTDHSMSWNCDVFKLWRCSEDSGDGEPDLNSDVLGLGFFF